MERRDAFLGIVMGIAGLTLGPSPFAWAGRSKQRVSRPSFVGKNALVSDDDLREVRQVFWVAAYHKRVINHFMTAAQVAGFPEAGLTTSDLLTIGYQETRLGLNTTENAGAKGVIQIIDSTFIRLVADYGNDPNILFILSKRLPVAAKVLNDIFPRLPRDEKTNTFLDCDLRPHQRKSILALRSMGKPKGFLVDLLFGAKDLAVMSQHIVGKPNAAVLHELHKRPDPKNLTPPKQGVVRQYALLKEELKRQLIYYNQKRTDNVVYARRSSYPQNTLT